MNNEQKVDKIIHDVANESHALFIPLADQQDGLRTQIDALKRELEISQEAIPEIKILKEQLKSKQAESDLLHERLLIISRIYSYNNRSSRDIL